jgi:hypothetical protein
MAAEQLVDAVDRLFDRIEQLWGDAPLPDDATQEAFTLAYLAYCRERDSHDQAPSEFPKLGLRLPWLGEDWRTG